MTDVMLYETVNGSGLRGDALSVLDADIYFAEIGVEWGPDSEPGEGWDLLGLLDSAVLRTVAGLGPFRRGLRPRTINGFEVNFTILEADVKMPLHPLQWGVVDPDGGRDSVRFQGECELTETSTKNGATLEGRVVVIVR